MTTPLDTQLRRYTELFETRLGEIALGDVVSTGDAPSDGASRHGEPWYRSRPWLVAAASASAVALLVGGAALLRSPGTDRGPDATVPPPPTTIVSSTTTGGPMETTSTIPADPEPAPVGDVSFEWLAGGAVESDGVDVLHDGERFLLLGPAGLRTSQDGLEWLLQDLEGPVAEATASAEWSSADAGDGVLVRLVTDPGQARVYIFDLRSGTVGVSVLPIPLDSRLRTSVRGDVALGRGGIVVFLHSDAVGGGTESVGYHSVDGEEWLPIDGQGLPSNARMEVVAIADGYMALSTPDGPGAGSPQLWFSSEGLRWEQRPLPDGGSPIRLVAWGDRAWAHHESAFGPASLSVNPSWILGTDGAYEVRPGLPPITAWVVGYGPATDAGAAGLVAVFGVVGPDQDESTAEYFVEFSPDALTWSRIEFPTELGVPHPFVSPAVGSDRIVVLVSDGDGSALVVGVRGS